MALGAYVRLSQAGLGCPDWPGCYGRILVSQITPIDVADFKRPFQLVRAHKEMLHRYVAGSLVFLVFLQACLITRHRKKVPGAALSSWILVLLILMQALLGMWTVTLKLHPTVVMGHLLGGLLTLCLVVVIFFKVRHPATALMVAPRRRSLRSLVTIVMAMVMTQILLGGWVSATYSVLACPDFPTCQGQWWPSMDPARGFDLSHPIGPDYEFGHLAQPARTAIHMAHRMGGLVIFFAALYLLVRILQWGGPNIKRWGQLMFFLVLVQVSLGIGNILFDFPLGLAVAHHVVGALFLLSLFRIRLLTA